MKLSPKEFKRFKELEKLIKAKKTSSEEQAEFDALAAKKNETGSNDPKWWMNYPELVKNVVNLPFNYIPGTSVSLEDDAGGSLDVAFGNVFKVNFIEAIGKSISNADPFNTQIRQLWLDLHRKYRGIGTYEQADLGIAILGIRSVFNLLAKFERIYGVINTYQVGNRVVPNGLKDALGISLDIEQHLADYRYWLNFYIEKMKQLCLPKGLSAIESDIALLSNVFKDSQDRRACLFLYDTETYGVYNPTVLSTGGCIEYFYFNKSGVTPSAYPAFTVNDIINTLSTAVNALLDDDDIARICSDLLAAYGPENVETLVNMPEQYYVVPVYDYERLLMFHNTTINGELVGIYDTPVISGITAGGLNSSGIASVIYQENNTVKSEFGVISGAYVGYAEITDAHGNTHTYPMGSLGQSRPKVYDCMLDMHTENPNEADIMVGSRLTALAEVWVLSSGNYYQPLAAWGTQVVTTLEVFRFDNSSHTYGRHVMSGSHMTTLAFFDALITQCDWHPTFYVESTNNGFIPLGDIDNFTVINVDNLRRIHEVAIMSGFKFSQITYINK